MTSKNVYLASSHPVFCLQKSLYGASFSDTALKITRKMSLKKVLFFMSVSYIFIIPYVLGNPDEDQLTVDRVLIDTKSGFSGCQGRLVLQKLNGRRVR